MTVLSWILASLAFICMLVACLVAWRALFHVKHLASELRVAIAAFGRPIRQPESADFTYIKESPPLTGVGGLAFFRQLHQSQFWTPLAHKFQADTRELLLQTRAFHADGKPHAATFASGAAFYASQQAVMVERQIATLAQQVQREAENKKLDEMAGLAESQRPARY